MDSGVPVAQIERLTGLVGAADRYDLPHAELREAQVAAANERFQTQRGRIKALGLLADEAGLGEVRALEDLVPLLLAHTSYKSYPESWLTGGKWERMARWLATVSAYPVAAVEATHVAGLDDWLQRLEAGGTYVSCSSGTTGKCSMMVASADDRAFNRRHSTLAFAWATGAAPSGDYKLMGTVPIPPSPRNRDIHASLAGPYCGGDEFTFPGTPITIGRVSEMVVMRRRIAEGVADPSEIAAYDRLAAERQAGIDAGIEATADALIANRDRKLIISGQFAIMYKVTEAVRAKGYGRQDFRPDNRMMIGGGLKGAVLPAGFLDYIMDAYNVSYDRLYQYYGMQEINSNMPRCSAGRYHVPPWVIPLALDRPGETLAAPCDGEVEGRGAFLDLSLDGRWGGVISGDRITLRYGRCDCGHAGPTVGPDIVRYADLGDGDKITCAGTIDAYVRGM
jgi:hypothetical protein